MFWLFFAFVNGVIQLRMNQLEQMTTMTRNESVVVLFLSTSPSHNCQDCNKINRWFKNTEKSYLESKLKHPLRFAVADAAKDIDTFRKAAVGTVPLIRFYPALKTNTLKEKYNVQFSNYQAKGEGLTVWLSYLTEQKFEYHEPFDYATAAQNTILLLFGSVVLMFFLPILKPMITSTVLYAFGSIMFILVMMGGFMWTRLRNAPWQEGNQFVSGGMQRQTGAEIAITSFFSGLCSIAVFLLANEKDQRKSLMYCLVLLFSFHQLSRVFAMKMSYPIPF